MSANGEQPGPRPTIRDVAERAGVSKSLVSLVLQGSPKVSADRRAAVDRAIAELGYRPNAAARTLREGRSRAIGVLLNDVRHPWFVDLPDGGGNCQFTGLILGWCVRGRYQRHLRESTGVYHRRCDRSPDNGYTDQRTGDHGHPAADTTAGAGDHPRSCQPASLYEWN